MRLYPCRSQRDRRTATVIEILRRRAELRRARRSRPARAARDDRRVRPAPARRMCARPRAAERSAVTVMHADRPRPPGGAPAVPAAQVGDQPDHESDQGYGDARSAHRSWGPPPHRGLPAADDRISPDAQPPRDVYLRRVASHALAPIARASSTYRRWVIATSLGELAAFSVPTTVWGLTAVAGLSDGAAYLPVVLAGAGEGAVLGYAQSRVLRSVLPALDPRAWVRVTAAAGALGWAWA